MPYWHQLVLSWYHHQPESHQQSFNQSSEELWNQFTVIRLLLFFTFIRYRGAMNFPLLFFQEWDKGPRISFILSWFRDRDAQYCRVPLLECYALISHTVGLFGSFRVSKFISQKFSVFYADPGHESSCPDISSNEFTFTVYII